MAVYAATLALGRLLLTAIYWYSARDGRLLNEPQDPATVRCFLIRGVTIPAIFMLSVGLSYFSVQAAVWSWVLLLVVDALVVRRRSRR